MRTRARPRTRSQREREQAERNHRRRSRQSRQAEEDEETKKSKTYSPKRRIPRSKNESVDLQHVAVSRRGHPVSRRGQQRRTQSCTGVICLDARSHAPELVGVLVQMPVQSYRNQHIHDHDRQTHASINHRHHRSSLRV